MRAWTPPSFHAGKESYVAFNAFDPVSGKMKRKKIMVGRIKGKHAQQVYTKGVIARLTERLLDGWNPWVESGAPMEYTPFDVVCDAYRDYIHKLVSDDDMREETLASYVSYLRIFRTWCEGRGLKYVFQVNRRLAGEFLDYVFVERNVSLQTRNNYLAWLKTFSQWLLQRSYIEVNPTEGMMLVHRRAKKKNREVICERDLQRLHDYLMQKNRHYLLACQMLHYMFIRPRELSYIKVGDIHLQGPSLVLHGETTKNHNDAVLTIPKKVVELMVDLGVLGRPSDYYLFSDGFMPGRERKTEKAFRDYWLAHVRKDLKFPASYKFYSLKDTGITNMLKANLDVLTVRDQARHSSILITDTYTPKDVMAVNKVLVNYEGSL